MNRLTRFFYFLNKRLQEDSKFSTWLSIIKHALLCVTCIIVGILLSPDGMTPGPDPASYRVLGGLLGVVAYMMGVMGVLAVMIFKEPVTELFSGISSHVRGAWSDANPKKDADGNPPQFGVVQIIDDESEVADERRSNRLGR